MQLLDMHDPAFCAVNQPSDLCARVHADHVEIELLLDRLQLSLADRDVSLSDLSVALRAHFDALYAVLPELQKRIVYPPLTTSHHGRLARLDHQLTQLARISPRALEFDQALQRLIDLAMEQIDEECEVLAAIAATFPPERRSVLSVIYMQAQKTLHPEDTHSHPRQRLDPLGRNQTFPIAADKVNA